MNSSSPEAGLIQSRQNKFNQIVARGVDPYPSKFEYSHTVSEAVAAFSTLDAAALEQSEQRVRTCGRIMAIRGFGKASFCHLSDGLQKIQFYVKKNEVSDQVFALFEQMDTGDIVGVEGRLFRTKTGELTILAKDLVFLAKCFLPLPEKWHGLTDVEIRYRQRYLDLIVNPAVRETFRKRSQIIGLVRKFLEERRYIEVETPMMHPIAGGATARPFLTHHNTLNMHLFLRIAPELYLKRLIAGGMERVYEINRNFRNEGISTQHNPEFTMLEFYQSYSDYHDLIQLTQEMLHFIVDEVAGSRTVKFKDMELDFNSFRQFSMRQAVGHFWNRGGEPPAMSQLSTKDGVTGLLRRAGIEFDSVENHGNLLGLLFEEIVEEQLVQPTFIYEYPVELSPLSKRSKSDPAYVDRFELYIAGMEIANAFSELNDPADQEERFRQQMRQRERGDEEAQMMDEDYIRALSYGMPPTAGEGIGIDRLTMILTDSPSIRDVILFPLMKPKGADEAEDSPPPEEGQ